MELWSEAQRWIFFQLLIGYVFVTSGLIVSALMLCTYIIVWPFNKDLYRKLCCNLAYSHWCQMTFLGQWWSGSDCTVHTERPEWEKLVGKESCIVIMNHKYDIDWLMTWMLAERYAMLGETKIYGKSILKFVPLIGWAWTFTESIFLKREWHKDREIIKHDLKYLVDYPDGYIVCLLLFPEGTRFTDSKHKSSNEIARQKGLPELKHHLLPRTKGFVLTMNGIKGKIPAIYDLTVGFRKDGAEPTLMNIINGKGVKAEIFFRRISTDDVPIHTDEACSQWLHQLFREKDEIFDNFVKDGTFKRGTKITKAKRLNDLLMVAFWNVLLVIPLFRYLVHIFLSGTLTVQITTILLILLSSGLIRWMISFTEIHRGSEYGGKTDSSVMERNDQNQNSSTPCKTSDAEENHSTSTSKKIQ